MKPEDVRKLAQLDVDLILAGCPVPDIVEPKLRAVEPGR